MKKIYIALAAVFAALVALMIIYRINNPPDNAPAADYTRAKAELLLHNYRQDSDETDVNTPPDHSKIYGVMIEQTFDKADGGSAADFVFFDCFGVCTHMCSDGSGYARYENSAELAELARGVLTQAGGIYDETFSRAKKTNYDVPHANEVKIYVRAGDGVFYKTYSSENAPKELTDARLSALEAAENVTK